MVPCSDPPHRRAFLRFLAASPVLASAGLVPRWFEELLSAPLTAQEQNAVLIEVGAGGLTCVRLPDRGQGQAVPSALRRVRRRLLNDETLRADRDAYARYQVKVRRLLGLTKVDQSVQILGRTWDSPFISCPVGRLRRLARRQPGHRSSCEHEAHPRSCWELKSSTR